MGLGVRGSVHAPFAAVRARPHRKLRGKKVTGRLVDTLLVTVA